MAQEQGDYAAARTLQGESLTIRRELGTKRGIAVALDAYASLNNQEQYPQRAARLWGAATSLREAIGTSRPRIEREKYDVEVAESRAALGEAVFVAAFEEGRAMTWEQAVVYALEEQK